MSRNHPRRRGAAGTAAPPRDRGFNLVEVVVTIALLGIVIVPVMTAVLTAIRSSQVNESAAQVETLLVNAVDRVNRADRASYQCDYTPAVEAAVLTVGWPASSVVVDHHHLDGGVWVSGGCPVGGINPLLVQRVTIAVTSPDASLTRSIEVVKGGV